jgi:outer membrane protein
MNKIKTTVLLASLCLAAGAQADTILGMTMSLDGWSMDSSGSISDNKNQQNFGMDSEHPALFSIALEHPLPLIPNFRLRYADLSSSGANTLSQNFTLNGTTYTLGTPVDVNFDLKSSDFIFYYELLDNDAVSLDLGVNGKYLDGDVRVSDGSRTAHQTFKGVVPMLYGAVKLGVPATRLSLFGDFNLLSVGGQTLRDYQAGASYTLIESMAMDFSVRGGYRRFDLQLDDLDGIYSDWKYDGVFLGIEADF